MNAKNIREIKGCGFTIDQIENDGYFSGYASVFNVVDQQMDMVLPGAFANCNAEKIKLLWQHDHSEPIGKILTLEEDKKGLLITARLLLCLRRGQEAYHLLKNNAIQGLSIGYTTTAYSMVRNNTVRLLETLSLWEISLVTFPANNGAVVTNVKSDANHMTLSDIAGELDRLIIALRA